MAAKSRERRVLEGEIRSSKDELEMNIAGVKMLTEKIALLENLLSIADNLQPQAATEAVHAQTD